jgi:hypothetical protein
MTFVNHGCNGTCNIGVESIYHEGNLLPREPMNNYVPRDYIIQPQGYQPVRGAHVEIVRNHKSIQAGEEILDNYLNMAGPALFWDYIETVQQECAGVPGQVEEYQNRNATAATTPACTASTGPALLNSSSVSQGNCIHSIGS